MPDRSQPGTFNRRTLDPVAIRALSKVTSWRSESWTWRSESDSFSAETPVRASIRCSWYHSAGRNSTSSRDCSPRRYSFEHGGPLYGRSGSRPTRRIETSAPSSRSHRAQLPAARPPPSSANSTWRSAIGGARAVGRELRRDLRLQSRVEDQQHLIPRLDQGFALGHESCATAQHRDDQRTVGQRHVLDAATGRLGALPDLDLDDLQVLLLEREQLDEPVLGDLVLDQPQDQVRRRYRRLDSQELEVLEVAGVVDTRHDPLDAVLLLRDLADQDVVLVVSGDRDHEIRPLDPGPLEHPQLSRVAVLDRVLELLLDHPVSSMIRLDQRHFPVAPDQ